MPVVAPSPSIAVPPSRPAGLPPWRLWLMAVRPFSLTASAIPVLLGTVLALPSHSFLPLPFLVALVGGVLLQIGTNLVNSYYDYRNGLDTPQNKGHIQPFLVLGWLPARSALMGGYVAFALAALGGFYLIAIRGWIIALLGVIGILGGYWYTAGPVNYKYRGLGVPLVFVLMGLLMTLGGYVVQTGRLSGSVLLASLPVACLVAAILHGNDLRDEGDDRASGVVSLTTWLGHRGAVALYDLLVAGAYATTLLNIGLGILPAWTLVVALTLPGAFHLIRRVHAGGELVIPVEPLTARLHLQFGLLLTAGTLVGVLLG